MLEAIPDVLSKEACASIRERIDADGYVDGGSTAGARAKRVKKNEQLGAEAGGKAELQKEILEALQSNVRFQRFAFPIRIARPLISRYREGMEYGLHVDNAMMAGGSVRSDLSMTVFLNDVADYDGGELEIVTGFGPVKVKLPVGSAVVYPSSTLHRVLPVTRGERICAVTWAQSRVRDIAKREILIDLERVRAKLTAEAPDAEETDRAHRSYANLLRMWIES